VTSVQQFQTNIFLIAGAWTTNTSCMLTHVCDPTIWQLGFDLSQQQCSLLNHFYTYTFGATNAHTYTSVCKIWQAGADL